MRGGNPRPLVFLIKVPVSAGERKKGMTIEEQKAQAKKEKETLVKMIVTYQSRTSYTVESLQGKTLRQLQTIYDDIMSKG